jgi:Arm DNA-binding domain
MERTELPTGPRGRVRLHDEPGPRVRLYDEVKATKRSKAKAYRMHLTEEKIAALPAKAKAYDVWDAGGRGAVRGLGVQVLPSGTKTYRDSFRFKGTPQAISYKLGRWPGLSLDEARKKAVAAERLSGWWRKGRILASLIQPTATTSRTLSRPGTGLSRLDG